MALSDISQQRLVNQQIVETKFTTPREAVEWMGAIQAQDYAMAKWALGLRLINVTEQRIEDAINKAEIIRTHLMRPTWHLVSAKDVRWMLALTAPHIKSSVKSMQTKLGLNDTIFNRTNDIIEKSLAGNKNLTRTELMAELKRTK